MDEPFIVAHNWDEHGEARCPSRIASARGRQASESLPTERLAFGLHEVAAALGLSYSTVWRLVKTGKLRRVGGVRHVLVPRAEIDRFLAA